MEQKDPGQKDQGQKDPAQENQGNTAGEDVASIQKTRTEEAAHEIAEGRDW